MSAKILVGAMVTASVLAVAWGARDRDAPAPPVSARPIAEVPWLSKEAAAQIVAEDGNLGPLFVGLSPGGPAPSAEQRERIARFARDNRVQIDLEVADDELVAIRFDVTYGGCCGYEGAEVLALRAHRPRFGGGCSGGPSTWLNNWAVWYDDGTYLRARVAHNRAVFRWERRLTTEEVLARAEAVLGKDIAKVARAAGDRWSTSATGTRVLEVPYVQGPWEFAQQSDFGLSITAERGRVVELGVVLRGTYEHRVEDILRARWGRPTVRDTTWTWHRGDRVIEAELYEAESATVTLRTRA